MSRKLPSRRDASPGSDQHSVGGHRDFRRLWLGLTISQAGSAIGGTALPVVAVTLLNSSTAQVSLLAAAAAVTAAVIALPAGAFVEFRRKRPLMVSADLIRFLALCSVPLAYACHVLGFGQLCVVAVLNSVCQIVFTSASQANLVSLVSREQLVDANGRLQASTWLGLSVGPSVGGVLITLCTAVGTMLVDGVSYLASAAAVLAIRQAEPPPPARDRTASRWSAMGSGAGFVLGRPDLRAMIVSWTLFAGCVGLGTPLTSVFYLRELRFTPWQFGLIMGLPSLAGFAGSRLSRVAVRRFGPVPTMRYASYLRAPGYVVITAAVPGAVGVSMCCLGFAGLLFFSSLTNSAMTSYRQLQTPTELLSRVATFWSFATSAGQPVFIVLGGLLASVIGVRAALVVAAAGILASAALLPKREPLDPGAQSPRRTPPVR